MLDSGMPGSAWCMFVATRYRHRNFQPRSVVPDAHDVIANKRSIILGLPQNDLKGISGIEHPRWPGILIDNRNMHKATLFHDRQDILQHVVWVAVGDISRHYGCN